MNINLQNYDLNKVSLGKQLVQGMGRHPTAHDGTRRHPTTTDVPPRRHEYALYNIAKLYAFIGTNIKLYRIF